MLQKKYTRAWLNRKALQQVLAVVIAMLLAGHSRAEEAKPPKAEDQWVAEAIWAYTLAGGHDTNSVVEKLALATEHFPQSARIAYWRARFAAEAETSKEIIKLLSETLDNAAREFDALPPAARVERLNLDGISPQFQALRRLIELRKQESDTPEIAADAAMLRAVSLDPQLYAGWAALVESSDPDLAIRAAETWAQLEPDNALPLYGKAAVLFRECLAQDKPVSEAVIAAIEAGNKRPACRRPETPWPTGFSLTFDADMEEIEEVCPELIGEKVPEPFLRHAAGQLLSRTAWVSSPTVSESTFRQLFETVRVDSHELGFEEEVRRLRALVAFGLNLQHSNHLLYAYIDKPSARVLNRLEVLASSQGDYSAARGYIAIKKHVRQTARQIGDAYLVQANREKQAQAEVGCRELVLKLGLYDADAAATKVMEARFKDFDVPGIRVRNAPLPSHSPQTVAFGGPQRGLPSNTRGSTVLAHTLGADLVGLGVVVSRDGVEHTHGSPTLGDDTNVFREFPKRARDDGRYYVEDFDSEELQRISHEPAGSPIPVLVDQLRLIRHLNLQRRRNAGPYFVLHDPQSSQATDLAMLCNFAGYLTSHDPCVIASRDPRALRQLRDDGENCPLRIVQWIDEGTQDLLKGSAGVEPRDELPDSIEAMLSEEGLARVTEYADGVGLPVDQLIDVSGALSAVAERLHTAGLLLHVLDFNDDLSPVQHAVLRGGDSPEPVADAIVTAAPIPSGPKRN